MKKRQIIILGVVVIAALVAYFSSGKEDGTKKAVNVSSTEAKGVRFTRAQLIKNETLPLYVYGFGRINSGSSISLSTEVQGILKQGNVLFKEGSSFKKGDVLAKINNEEARYSLQARRSQYLTLVANILPDLKIDFPEDFNTWNGFYKLLSPERTLPSLPAITKQRLKTYLAAKNVLTEFYSIRKDEVRLNKYTLVAPFSGVIVNTNAEIGSLVSPGTAIATLKNSTQLELSVPVSHTEAKLLNPGNPTEIKVGNSDNFIAATVSRVGSYIDPKTQSVPVYIRTKNQTSEILDGMYLEAKISCGNVKNASLIPRSAISQNNTVYAIADSTLQEIKVTIKKLYDDEAIVTNLPDGIMLVTQALNNPSLQDKYVGIVEL